MRPLHEFVLVEPAEQETMSRGGIVIPDVAKNKPQEGTVLAVGNGRVLESGERVAPAVSVGDRVLFRKYGGDYIERDGKEFLLVRESDLLAVLGLS